MQKLSFRVNGELTSLDWVLKTFGELRQSSIPKKDWLQCQLAIAEGFTNAVRHAHRDLPPEIPITVEVSVQPQALEIRIWDSGPPFDLDGFLEQHDWSREQLLDHGQGLLILKKISTHLSYTRSEDNRNCLHIVKEFSAS